MKPLMSDSDDLKDDSVLEGRHANYFDDLHRVGTDSFRAKYRATHEKSEMRDC